MEHDEGVHGMSRHRLIQFVDAAIEYLLKPALPHSADTCNGRFGVIPCPPDCPNYMRMFDGCHWCYCLGHRKEKTK